MSNGIGKMTTALLKDGYSPELCCPAPGPHISKQKPAILFIGLNPAGDKNDAERDKATDGLYLNYYKEFEGEGGLTKDFLNPKCSDVKTKKKTVDSYRKLVYKSYYEPILYFFGEATGKKGISWEWCNYDFNELITVIKNLRGEVDPDDIDCLKKCYDNYKTSEYQLIVRDLVYYHQTSKFKEMLKDASDPKVKETVKTIIDSYIDMIPNLKLIYVSTATACHYIRESLISDEDSMADFGGIEYDYNGKTIPVLLAGRPLNGTGTIDIYSRKRLLKTVKDLLSDKRHL